MTLSVCFETLAGPSWQVSPELVHKTPQLYSATNRKHSTYVSLNRACSALLAIASPGNQQRARHQIALGSSNATAHSLMFATSCQFEHLLWRHWQICHHGNKSHAAVSAPHQHPVSFCKGCKPCLGVYRPYTVPQAIMCLIIKTLSKPGSTKPCLTQPLMRVVMQSDSQQQGLHVPCHL